MKRMLSVAVLAGSLLAGAVSSYACESCRAAAQARAAAAKPDLTWDAKVFEKNPNAFGFVKKVEGDTSVGWVLQVNSSDEAFRIQNYGGFLPHYDAVYLDDNDLSVGSVRLYPHTPDVAVGERVMFTLTLPTDDQFCKATKVVIRLR